ASASASVGQRNVFTDRGSYVHCIRSGVTSACSAAVTRTATLRFVCGVCTMTVYFPGRTLHDKKTTYLVALTIALFGAVAAFAAPASLQVTLSIAPNTTLPGLSVPLSLHVENGASALHLGPSVR